jgi:hypothetical protein
LREVKIGRDLVYMIFVRKGEFIGAGRMQSNFAVVIKDHCEFIIKRTLAGRSYLTFQLLTTAIAIIKFIIKSGCDARIES